MWNFCWKMVQILQCEWLFISDTISQWIKRFYELNRECGIKVNGSLAKNVPSIYYFNDKIFECGLCSAIPDLKVMMVMYNLTLGLNRYHSAKKFPLGMTACVLIFITVKTFKTYPPIKIRNFTLLMVFENIYPVCRSGRNTQCYLWEKTEKCVSCGLNFL